MKNFACPHDGSLDVFVQAKGSQTGLYCGDCGKWIKWLSKEEIKLVERQINSEPTTVKEFQPRKEINQDKLKELCTKVSNFIHENYDPHTTIIIKDDHIRVVQDIQGIPVKRWEQ